MWNTRKPEVTLSGQLAVMRQRQTSYVVPGQGCPPVDLLIRTSGEHRLSDFLLWQSHFALLSFSDTLWPDYSFWDLLQALVQYQRSYPKLQELAAVQHHTAAPVMELSQERGVPLQTGKAQHGINLVADVSNKFLKSSGEEVVSQGMADTEPSDSSVSSDSQPTSRPNSPLHGPFIGRQVLCELQQQPSLAQTVLPDLCERPLYNVEQDVVLQQHPQLCLDHELHSRRRVLHKQMPSILSSKGPYACQDGHAGRSAKS